MIDRSRTPRDLPGGGQSAAGAIEAARPLKQAVVLVHGMGEQMPMDTLRGFVRTMWEDSPAVDARRDADPPGRNPVWWKPDARTGSFELSRITTRAGRDGAGPRTDFFEFYWADLTAANTLQQLRDWFMSLLWRSPRQVPPRVRSVWVLLWLGTLIFGGLALWKAVSAIPCIPALPSWANAALAVATAAYGLAIGLVLATFGDVARYVRAKPPNIAARRAIRERGLDLLRRLGGSGEYQRIVLVGHSLGSIIAYDLLKLLWSEGAAYRTMADGDELHRAYLQCEAAAAALAQAPEAERGRRLETYRTAQRAVFDTMQARQGAGERWLISDFVTVGSPLSHAQFLLAHDAEALAAGVEERRFPTSPPVMEDPKTGFRYRSKGQPVTWQAHHAAPFAAVRWTNIYDPNAAILFGDIISGSVRGNFGGGIADLPVKIRRAGWGPFSRFFTHTCYWSETTEETGHLDMLREALDL